VDATNRWAELAAERFGVTLSLASVGKLLAGLESYRRVARGLRWPRQPTSGELMVAQRSFPPNYLHESWLDYLYWDSEIEN